MLKAKLTIRDGFSLVGLMLALAIGIIVILTVGVVLVDSQRGWSIMYNHIYSGVATDGYVARKEFDAAMRRAVSDSVLFDDAGYWVEAGYYSDGSSTVDRYVRFYRSDSNLNVEYGLLYDDDSKEILHVRTLCGNVSNCVFRQVGRSVQMILTLDDGTQANTVVSAAVLNN